MKPFLEFHSRVKCGPLLSLLIDKPDAEKFNAFVDELKQRARQEYNAFAGLKAGSLPESMAANVFEEPPEFDESEQVRIEKKVKPVRLADDRHCNPDAGAASGLRRDQTDAHCPGSTQRRSRK